MIYAVVLAAGLGTRMKTDVPKCAVPILKKPMVSYIVGELEKSNVDEIITIVGHKKEVIMDLLKDKVKYAHQKQMLGTANAVMSGIDYIKEDGITIILPGDTPLVDKSIFEGMFEQHHKENNGVTIGTLIVDNPYGLGRIIRDSKGNVLKIAEEYQANENEKKIKEINTCMFVINNQLLREYTPQIDNNNTKGEYTITDIVGLIAEGGYKVGTFTIEEQYKMAGINDLFQLSKVENAFRSAINQKHMLNGVMLLNSNTITIGPDVIIEPGVIVYPGTCLFGNTMIKRGSIIGPNTELENVLVEENAKVVHSVIKNSKIKSNADVGPFMFARDGAVIGENVRAGAFVEIKNSTIGDNSFASHLAYIGDAEIGKNVNFGCGCITANFDGVNKYKTVIKDNTFVGCNTNIIAPVTIGEKCYIAAGTNVTEDVEDETFVIGRSKMIKKNK